MRIARSNGRVTLSFGGQDVLVLAAGVLGTTAAAVAFVMLRQAEPVSAGPGDPAAQWAAAPVVRVETAHQPAVGPARAPVTIVEFTDYECPFCRQHAREVLPAFLDRWGDSVRYVVRNFPNLVVHRGALAAAEAAACAHRQGRFWEYRRVLVGRPLDLSAARLQAAGREAALDSARFAACVDERQTRAVVADDLLAGWEAGVFGTPTFVVNGRRIAGERSGEALDAFVRFALSARDTAPRAAGPDGF